MDATAPNETRDGSQLVHISPADCVVCGAAFSCVSLTLLGSDIGFLIACLGIPFALVWGVRLMRDYKHRTWGLRVMTYGSVMALTVSGPASCSLHTRRTETALQPLIEALEQHRVQTGHYPKKLVELKSPQYSGCRGVGDRPAYYSSASAGEQFSLTCVTFGMNKHTYESETRRWKDWD
ncbi:MAG: hypothetical protein JNN20_13930 [Betaproteobacteria bacterium]|nr:hypothetical protein [Betaproteobacteria bacterium]